MIHTKSIKFHITNNQSHISALTDKISSLSCSENKGNNYEISEFLPVLHSAQKASQMQASYHTEELQEEEDYIDVNNFDAQPKQDQQRSMFTIRQEQSYEYESETESLCKMKKMYHESYIDDLSTIKNDNGSYHHTNKSYKVSQFDHLCSEKLMENPTMTSLLKNRVLSEQILVDKVQGWEEKIYNKSSEAQEEVQQEEIVALKEEQKALKLNMMKMHRTGAVLKPDEKIKTGFDIVYNCSDEQLQQIRKILEKEGIKLIERNPRVKQKNQQVEKTEKVRKLGFKKVKLKIIKNNNNKI